MQQKNFGALHFQILQKYFRSFMFSTFFEKFPKVSRNFPKIFPTSKKLFFVPKIVQNHYINQNLVKFSLKISKIAEFSLNPHFFKNISAFSAKNSEFFVPKTPIFWSLGPSPLSWGPPKINSNYGRFRLNFLLSRN